MNEIKCPKCGEVFQVSEADYASIANQVKNLEFNKELETRIAQLNEKQKIEQENVAMKQARQFEQKISEKQNEVNELASTVRELQGRIQDADALKKLELQAALNQKERDIKDLKSMVEMGKKDTEVALMQQREKALKCIQEKENKLVELQLAMESVKNEAEKNEKRLKENFETQLKQKDEAIDYYKDLKSKLSTKMIGESLEVHCSTEFNKVRTTMYPNAYFEKDNDASGGSKGDFIFRDYIDDQEYVSMMFEMKNEADTTATKHKNEDFFAKLDKDRNEKKCEYAVLVSLLEPDNELYNNGIVDVSYRYPKMYVVRPQFFMPLISLLTNASRKSVDYQRELAIARSQSIDVTNFEMQLMDFKDKFGRNYALASAKFKTAIEEIDKSISHLLKIKESLVGSENNLRLANNKVEELSIKKLTKDNPTMKAKFEEARVVNGDAAPNE